MYIPPSLPAFVSCWMELRAVRQEDLVTSLKQALSTHNIPEITQTILNLAEFMEHCEEATVRLVGVKEQAVEGLIIMLLILNSYKMLKNNTHTHTHTHTHTLTHTHRAATARRRRRSAGLRPEASPGRLCECYSHFPACLKQIIKNYLSTILW